MLDQNGDAVVGRDADEGVWRERRRATGGTEGLGRAGLGFCPARQVDADDERAGPGEQRAAGEIDVVSGHGQPSSVRAASWIAERMRA